MSARQPFFPQAPVRPESRANFVPDPTNSLHTGAKPGSFATEQPEQHRRSLNNPFSVPRRQQESPPAGGKPGTSGLGMLKKRSSATDKGAMTMANAIRPGTANPYSRTFQSNGSMPQIPLMAPTPQKPSRTSPALLTQTTSSFTGPGSAMTFKAPFPSDSNASSNANADKNTHTSALDANPPFKAPADDFSQAIRFRPASRANGPQRVPIDQGPAMLNSYANGQASNGHDLTVDERLKFNTTRQNNKRSRDEVDEDENESPQGNQIKRFKSHDQIEALQERDMRNKTQSPSSTDRPSSGLSRSMERSQIRQGSDLRSSPDSHRRSAPEYQPQNSLPAFKVYSQYETSVPQATPEPRPLEKLLGTDPDAYVKKHMDVYDGMVNRWTNCSIEQWKAGADEIAAEYRKLLDYVKVYVETKLNLYGNFHTNVRTHNATLDERKLALDRAQKKIVKESGTVLK